MQRTIGLALLLLHWGRKYAGDEAGFLAAAAYLLSYATARQIGLRVRFRVHTPGGDEDPYPVFTPMEGA